MTENIYISQVKDILINNNMDRIQINGVWYIRETPEEQEQVDAVLYQGCVAETEKHCFDATRLREDSEEFDIKVTYKKGSRSEWKEDLWDNTNFLKGVFNGDPDALNSLRESIDDEAEIKYFISFLQILKDNNWF